MNAIDVIIVVFAVALAAIGYERGLVRSALPLAGFVGGAALGARVGPALLAGGAESEYAPLVAVLSGIVVGSLAAVVLDGIAEAVRLRLGRGGAMTALDGVGGAGLFAALGLLIAWGFGAVALHTPENGARDLREAVQRSAILNALNDVMPPSGPLLNVLRRVDPTPTVRGPEADVAPPQRGIVEDADVVGAASGVVRVLGTACGLGVAGSGWVARPGVVVTNAHVVAGSDDTTVTPGGGSEADAQAVHYDPRNDLAILRAPGLTASALPLDPDPEGGTAGAVIGYPENGPLALRPVRLGGTGVVTSQDSYGRGPIERTMTPFRGEVRSGNSGGPVVDAEGEVLTTVFAASTRRPPSGLGVPNEIVAEALAGPLGPTGTGPCAA